MIKFKRWLRRYGPAEILGITLSVVAATSTEALVHHAIIAAYAGTIGDYLGYYSWITYRERKGIGIKKIKKLLVEFAPAEILDFFIVKPAAIYTMTLLITPYALGALVGTLIASILFYIPVIILYRMQRK